MMGGPQSAPVDAVARDLGTDARHGLSGAAARDRLERYGPNRRTTDEGTPYAAIGLRQLREPLTLLLAVAAAVSVAIGDVAEAIAIATIVALNAVLGFVQEARAERAVRALRDRLGRRARVVRDGVERTIEAHEVVPGDLLVLAEGERVEADARLVEARGLAVDESVLTGESVPVDKQPDPVPEDVPLAERTSMVYADTWVTRGDAVGLATATGPATASGQAAALVARARPPATPLQRRLGQLTRIAVVAGVAITGVLTAGMLVRGSGWHEAVLTGVAVAIAAVPEGLAATVTIALALGARSMAARGAIVQRLQAVETLGETTVICTDKTGTLTENRLRVAAALPEAGVTPARLLGTAVLASGLRTSAGGSEISAADPLDAAVVAEAREQGVDVAGLLAETRGLEQIPFDASRRRVTAVVESAGIRRVVVKGAPEAVLPRTELDAPERDRVTELVEALAAQGIRVLAVAERVLDGTNVPAEEPDLALRLLGLVGFRDPLRPTVTRAVSAARDAGIGVMMLTGDHPTTAAAIGRALGLGPEAIRARVEPADKLRTVEQLQERGEIVAVTGDGVNDAAALRRADVGVAMGRAGTEAAREASSVVLVDDDFSTIVAAVREGRRIGDNVRKFVAFLLSANLGEVVAFAVAVLAGLGPPLTVVQVLVLNVLTDGLPAVALSLDPAAGDVMARPPERRGRLFPGRTWTVLGLLGLAVGGVAVAAFVVGRAVDGVAAGQTMAFLTIGVAELLLVFTLRSESASAWREPRNDTLVVAVVASLGLLAVFVALPAFREPFGTVAIDATQVGVVLALAALPAGLVEMLKAIGRRRRRLQERGNAAVETARPGAAE